MLLIRINMRKDKMGHLSVQKDRNGKKLTILFSGQEMNYFVAYA
jgi:hypothetical protein